MHIGSAPMDIGRGSGKQEPKRNADGNSDKNKNKCVAFQSSPPFFVNNALHWTKSKY